MLTRDKTVTRNETVSRYVLTRDKTLTRNKTVSRDMC